MNGNGHSGTSCLNILDHSLRSIGEMQVLNPAQPRLLEGILRPLGALLNACPGGGRVQDLIEPQLTPPDGVISYTVEQQRLVMNTPVNLIYCYEFYACDAINSSSNIDIIQNWTSFVDTKTTSNHAFVQKYRKPGLDEMSIAEKESWYWVLKTRNRDCTVVPAILDSAKQMNCKEWLLPNGIKVGIEDVKPITLEVIPTHSYLFQIQKFYQTGGAVDSGTGEVITPFAKLDEAALNAMPFLKMYLRRVIPEGITRTHHVIEATLPNDGGSYIVDPTSMQFNYRGPYGSLIAYGSWKEYENGFPGQIIQKIQTALYPVAYINYDPNQPVRMKTDIDEMYFLGEGPKKWITNLTKNILTYKGQRCCAYCGWIEGHHPVKPKEDFRYAFKAAILQNCSQCRGVAYCNKLCQKAHWKAHKRVCGRSTDTGEGNNEDNKQ